MAWTDSANSIIQWGFILILIRTILRRSRDTKGLSALEAPGAAIVADPPIAPRWIVQAFTCSLWIGGSLGVLYVLVRFIKWAWSD